MMITDLDIVARIRRRHDSADRSQRTQLPGPSGCGCDATSGERIWASCDARSSSDRQLYLENDASLLHPVDRIVTGFLGGRRGREITRMTRKRHVRAAEQAGECSKATHMRVLLLEGRYGDRRRAVAFVTIMHKLAPEVEESVPRCTPVLRSLSSRRRATGEDQRRYGLAGQQRLSGSRVLVCAVRLALDDSVRALRLGYGGRGLSMLR